MIQGVSENAQAIIERLQPYHAAQPPDNELAILRALNNIDKHKLLVFAICYASIPDTISFSGDRFEKHEADFFPQDWNDRKIRAEDYGAEFLRVRFTRTVKIGVYADITQDVAFEKFGLRENEPLIPGLKALRDAVVKAIKLFNDELLPE